MADTLATPAIKTVIVHYNDGKTENYDNINDLQYYAFNYRLVTSNSYIDIDKSNVRKIEVINESP